MIQTGILIKQNIDPMRPNATRSDSTLPYPILPYPTLPLPLNPYHSTPTTQPLPYPTTQPLPLNPYHATPTPQPLPHTTQPLLHPLEFIILTNVLGSSLASGHKLLFRRQI